MQAECRFIACVRRKMFQIDCVGQDICLARAASEQVFRRGSAARHQMGGVLRGEGAKHGFDEPMVALPVESAVRVADAHGNARALRGAQGKRGERRHMRVRDGVSALFQQLSEHRHRFVKIFVERGDGIHLRLGIDAVQFLVKRGGTVREKIKTVPLPVDVRIIIEDTGGNSAEGGVADDLCYGNAPVFFRGHHSCVGRSSLSVSG